MIMLKPLLIDSTGWLEATWIDSVQSPDVLIPAKDAVFDASGTEISPSEPKRVEPGAVTETQVQCTSYHPTQIDMLRTDAAKHGTTLDEYEEQIAAWVAAYIPLPPEPTLIPEPIVVSAFQARAALLQAGLLQAIEDYMALPDTDPFVKLAWDKAQDFRQDSLTVKSLAGILGLTDGQLGDLFGFAKTISA